MTQTSKPVRPGRLLQLRAPLALAVGAALIAGSASAAEFTRGDFSMTIDTTLTYGASQRVEDRDDRLVGKINLDPTLGTRVTALQAQNRWAEAQALAASAPGRFSVNSDDGNLKYDSGDLISNALGITSEVGMKWRNWGAFFRGTGFRDFETMSRDDISDVAKDRIGQRVRLLDAFVYTDFNFGESVDGSFRLGRQVVSWGESTFIQNGINVVNPVDVSRLRVAGAELKEAFLPQNSIWASFNLTENLSLEALYMLEWSETEVEPSGTYFSNNDFGLTGGEFVMLNFGLVDEPANFEVCRTTPALDPRCGAAFPRSADREAKDSGQFGLALRYYASELGDTEFGFYYLRYHSRLPFISGTSITSASPTSGRYFIEYPEDINLYGLSWNTNIGTVAFQGEISYRDNAPLQIDDVEVLFAGLSPLNPLIQEPFMRFRSRLGQFGLGEYLQGWERHEVSQLQFTLTKAFGPGNFLGADQIATVGEFGGTKVWDLPAVDVLPYQGDGTDTGCGPDWVSGGGRNPLDSCAGMATSFSWGYRLAVRADYNSVGGSTWNLSPRIAFNHDVNGTTPGAGGNFVDGRKSSTLGVEGNYLNKWVLDLSYTSFWGGGVFNLTSDRDFVAVSAKYLF
jgi:hypothetical protein